MLFIGKLIYSTLSSKSKVENIQQKIRDVEWQSILKYIDENSSFLDVGCGAGYAMQKAQKDKNCIITGVDPEPNKHGVGRYEKDRISIDLQILKGFSENLPLENESFDVVYSSHVLEHVNDEIKSLKEFNRVLRKDGIIIIGVPTASMALVNFVSQILFTTHIKMYEFFRFILKKGSFNRLISIFRITSHSIPRASSIWYDIFYYRTKRWKNLIESEFVVNEIIYPFFYPYPDYIQFFKARKLNRISSSVFFICKKKS
jgi:ubiquinone/menaquinone biosynthesis C-methylase UbiE